uniref:Retrotransposon protein, putative, Ty1-copia subclass n=2 Tax=Oryza sativa subsp. japonica TaxID=39947 RepID=Q6AU25_ORYSJ|nr:putative polyprotein [Oryza sativa Japonica Group]ABF97617.1 retrotransposon protein, putative, Ty1-copia subclass [Oryza sativa Japonica Group]
MARTMLDEYKTSDRFWAEAVNTACHAINRLYLHHLLKKTPYELLTSNKPNVSYFRVFGSKCYILNKKARSSKFAPKVDEGFLLGYGSNECAYPVFNKTSGIVEIARDVTFDETNGSQVEQVDSHVLGEEEDPSEAIKRLALGDVRPREPQQGASSSTQVEPTTSTQADDPSTSNVDQGEDGEQVPPSPINLAHPRIHQSIQRDHPTDNILGAINKGVSTRSRIANFCEHYSFLSSLEPLRVEETLNHPDWVMAQQEELNNFTQNEVWTLMERPRQNVIGTKWIFRNKQDETGVIIRNKASLPQRAGPINELVYVEQPPGFENPKYPNHVYKLHKALYGLKQAPRAWYECLQNFLVKNGFEIGKADSTLFTKRHDNDIFVCQIYVDDIIFGCTNKSFSEEFSRMMTKRFEMSMIGELKFFLGLQIKQLKEGTFICQTKYLKDMLKKFGMENAKLIHTPMPSNGHLDLNEQGKDVDQKVYRSIIGSLLYLCASRPDIMLSVCMCARFQAAPKECYLVAVKRILRYLVHTPNLGLWYTKGARFDLIGYADADYAGCKVDRKSTSGTCQFLGRMPPRKRTSRKSKRQRDRSPTPSSHDDSDSDWSGREDAAPQYAWVARGGTLPPRRSTQALGGGGDGEGSSRQPQTPPHQPNVPIAPLHIHTPERDPADWCNEVIAQFYATVFFDPYHAMQWMTQGSWFSVSYPRLAEIWGFDLHDLLNLPDLHNLPIPANADLLPLYIPNDPNVVLGKVDSLKPYFAYLNRMFHRSFVPKDGDASSINHLSRTVLVSLFGLCSAEAKNNRRLRNSAKKTARDVKYLKARYNEDHHIDIPPSPPGFEAEPDEPEEELEDPFAGLPPDFDFIIVTTFYCILRRKHIRQATNCTSAHSGHIYTDWRPHKSIKQLQMGPTIMPMG